MLDLFLDTSALGKHYHPEAGSRAVDLLLADPGARSFISQLTTVEILSAFAKKVRTGAITAAEFRGLIGRFRADVSAKRFTVVRLAGVRIKAARQLVRKLGPAVNLRTLDAIQLAVALDLNAVAGPVHFVCADQALCTIAAGEGLTVINPEVP